MKISDLFVDEVELPIDVKSVDKRPFKFSYRPSLYTNAFRLSQLNVNMMIDGLCDGIITQWNLEDEEGEVLPITTETFLALPVALIARMMDAMQEHSFDTKN